MYNVSKDGFLLEGLGTELRGVLILLSRTDCPMVEAIETGFPRVPVI